MNVKLYTYLDLDLPRVEKINRKAPKSCDINHVAKESGKGRAYKVQRNFKMQLQGGY